MLDKDSLLAASHYEQPYQKEKDYIEEMFLAGIYDRFDNLIFKGGTALSKFYDSVRFSDDLDFSLAEKKESEKIGATLEKMVGELSVDYPIKVMRRMDTPDATTYELSIRGPLFEMLNKYQHLKIEISKNASVVETANTFRRNPIYEDLKPYLAIVMSLKEILAEKTEALLFRHNLKARDLYDLYFLLQKGTEIKVSLIDRKMREQGHTFTVERFIRRVDVVAEIWEKELRRLLPKDKFVAYNTVKKSVIDGFRTASIL
jgi:predicted nucleotidyltransferase component of viral defense system